MTQDEIIRMARDAGWNDLLPEAMKQVLERFADLVAEATKEKAAKVCEEMGKTQFIPNHDVYVIPYKPEDCAAAIRNMK
jgi:acyl-CoA reductase-like NAD-dependent aldehyde dehydrogenase